MRPHLIATFPLSVHRLLLRWGLLAVVATLAGCTPKIVKFYVTIPTTSPPLTETEIAAHQGTIHLCPGTSVKLLWAVKGRASLSATPGPRYQPPECFSMPTIPSKGTRVARTCEDVATFRVTASHSFWRRFGSCPGPGCPNADREVVAAPTLNVDIGNNLADCRNEACEVANTKAAIDWDDRYRVGTVSLVGLPVAATLHQILGCTLTVGHEGREATFDANVLTSDVFRGQRIAGTWNLRLSMCASPPPALVIRAQVDCAR